MAKRLAFTLLVLFSVRSALWAEPPARRALERKRVELQIAKLEERLEISPAAGEEGWRGSQLELAAARLEMARKLLARNNLRAAETVADQAERVLDRAEKKVERQ